MSKSFQFCNETFTLDTDLKLQQLEFIARGGDQVAGTVDQHRRGLKLLMNFQAVGGWPLREIDLNKQRFDDEISLARFIGPGFYHVADDHPR